MLERQKRRNCGARVKKKEWKEAKKVNGETDREKYRKVRRDNGTEKEKMENECGRKG